MAGIRMKALTTFQGAEGKVRMGREFTVSSENRAKELEKLGRAVPMSDAPKAKSSRTKTSAEKSGPLSTKAGGQNGATSDALSSRRGRARRVSK